LAHLIATSFSTEQDTNRLVLGKFVNYSLGNLEMIMEKGCGKVL